MPDISGYLHTEAQVQGRAISQLFSQHVLENSDLHCIISICRSLLNKADVNNVVLMRCNYDGVEITNIQTIWKPVLFYFVHTN